MNDQSFFLKALIINSNHNEYTENKLKKLHIIKKIGEGSYGSVYQLNNNHVIKIFKNSTFENTKLEESNYLIPIKNENRELLFFFKYSTKKKEFNYIINAYAIGIIKNKIIHNDNTFEINSYFIILPLCYSFYDIFKMRNQPLINKTNGITFTLNVMKRLLEISNYFENKYNLINIDFKLNNFMFSDKNYNLNNLIMIDFSIIKSKSKNKKYNIQNKYYIWPIGNIFLDYIPPYSTCINGLELLFGHTKILNLYDDENMKNYLNIINSKNKNAYNIFYNGLILKINTENILKLFNQNLE
jgi:hypothetical protein